MPWKVSSQHVIKTWQNCMQRLSDLHEPTLQSAHIASVFSWKGCMATSLVFYNNFFHFSCSFWTVAHDGNFHSHIHKSRNKHTRMKQKCAQWKTLQKGLRSDNVTAGIIIIIKKTPKHHQNAFPTEIFLPGDEKCILLMCLVLRSLLFSASRIFDKI